MNSEAQNLPQASQEAARRRFRIEKLEERIAPSHKLGHEPPGQNYNEPGSPPGHNCHRGCRV